MSLIKNTGNWVPVMITLFAAAAFAVVVWCHGFSWAVSITDGIISAALLTGASFVAIHAIKSYPTKAGILVYSLLAGMLAGKAACALSSTLLKWFFTDNPEYLGWLEQTKAARLLILLLAASWIVTHAALRRKIVVLEEQFRSISDAATLHREAELFKLRQQLQPHFLYNSLNSINALIMILPEKAQEMIGKLSDFLRNSLKREGRDQIPIQEELDYIEAYLAIEAVRFGDRLIIDYDNSFPGNAMIPPFILQPLLENAIKFGVYGRTGDVKITMRTRMTEAELKIRIENPFDPDNRPSAGTGFGLQGIGRRLFLLYGRADLLETEQKGTQFITTLTIPQSDVPGNTH
ncbi:MAG: sensor histidine kinase [Sphingobacteriales bacterium]|nr:MAG: sensor histidine kinase [Sphingobacteriales bacterium]